MEGNRSCTNSRDLLRKINEFTLWILDDLSRGRSPSICIQRFRTYCANLDSNCNCSSTEPKGHEILTFQKESHVHRIDVLLRVLLIVQKLLQENKHGSKRDIYYMHPSVFSDQSVVDRAINDICILLQCSRHNLNVVSVGNGLVMGWLRFFEAGRKFDCINSPDTAHTIPVLVEDVKDLVSVAHYILVVEKESVFQRLANDQFCSKNRCIVITGRGYPDVPTRRFLRLLVDQLCLPVYCLVDCDPYGFDILTTYRFGSMQMAYDAKFLRVPQIQWLGAFPSDSANNDLPKHCLLPLTTEDKRKTEAMLLRCYLQQEAPDWRSELELMLQREVKFEIEALSVHSLSFLSESCVMKVNINCETCRKKVMEVLQNLRGVYSVVIDADKGTLKISGKVNPYIILTVFEKYGKHGEVSCVKFDGEVREPGYYPYYGGNGYMPYGSAYSYPHMGGPLDYYSWFDRHRYAPIPPPFSPLGPPPPPPLIPPYGPYLPHRPPPSAPAPAPAPAPPPPPPPQPAPRPPPQPQLVINYFPPKAPPVVAPPKEMNPESCKIM